MKVVHVLASVDSSWGGPPEAVGTMAGAMAELGVESIVYGLHSKDSPVVDFGPRVLLQAYESLPRIVPPVPRSHRMMVEMSRAIQTSDIVHIHEMWHLPHLLAAGICRATSTPYVVSPHGSLNQWSLNRHGMLKKIAWSTYERRIMSESGGIHALTPTEARDIATLLPRAAITVVPNAVDPRRLAVDFQGRPGARGYPKPYLLFLGRLTKKKGLMFLLRVFSILAKSRADINLVIAGPDRAGEWAQLSNAARLLGVNSRVHYRGIVDEASKGDLMTNAEAFLLPSEDEGMSMSLLEALGCGTPVVISPGCNLPIVAARGAGRVVPLEEDAWASAIEEILTPDQQPNLRMNAARLASESFSAASLARSMTDFYAKVTSGN